MKSRIKSSLCAAVLMCFLVSPSWASIWLPEPVFPNAIPYDEYYSYSTSILKQLYPGYSVYPSNQGSLKDELKIWWGDSESAEKAAGDNLEIRGGYDFPDPLSFPNSGSTTEFNTDLLITWKVSVDLLYDFLQSEFENSNIPVFAFDINQIGGQPNMLGNGYVAIVDEFDDVAPYESDDFGLAEWAFDSSINGEFDEEALVEVPNTRTVEFMGVEYSFDTTGTNNVDFLVYAPTMDLAQFIDQGLFFTATFQYQLLSDGFEDFFILGYRSDNPPPPPVPEPATVALLGLGMVALAFTSRKLRK
ncbi:PEP-CTERM sorting domain-containing protein [Desulfomicrobium sp. ZS1]|uniref:PEP-CTERM sorting domain-containing protein n=1 Tax=Desulfomicrobium sp. ZS1 TaxID=2952228 RepID=UPI0020B1C23C|nr:PEP-CTERM sorting domain-containing protein [Desulfomicrobium sp. ZS1]UTF50686.1 PEP-CTERM sorting domain-containing protein [Desulfomicrobium sp. ZS1]